MRVSNATSRAPRTGLFCFSELSTDHDPHLTTQDLELPHRILLPSYR